MSFCMTRYSMINVICNLGFFGALIAEKATQLSMIVFTIKLNLNEGTLLDYSHLKKHYYMDSFNLIFQIKILII